MSGEVPPEILPWINIGAITSLFYIVWHFSKRMTQQDANTANQEVRHKAEMDVLKEKHNEDIKTIMDKQNEEIKQIYIKIEQMRAERKEEITKGITNNYDKFDMLQRQLDSIKSDVKDQASRMNVVDTKVKSHDEQMGEVNSRINKNLDFHVDWNQRVEDRVESAIAMFHELLAQTKKELMETMNMLIDLNNRDKKIPR